MTNKETLELLEKLHEAFKDLSEKIDAWLAEVQAANPDIKVEK